MNYENIVIGTDLVGVYGGGEWLGINNPALDVLDLRCLLNFKSYSIFIEFRRKCRATQKLIIIRT